jgi:hypothetical protein
MQDRYNVLFLCTGNSARSIMAEAILNRKGKPNFTAYSAGSHPTGAVRPEALKQIKTASLPTEGLRSKDWAEFATPGAPKMNFVFTFSLLFHSRAWRLLPSSEKSIESGDNERCALASSGRRISGNCVSGRGCCWVGNHGRAARRRQYCNRSAGQYDCNRRCSGGVDSCVWRDIGRAFESCCDDGGLDGRRAALGGSASLHLRSDNRRNRRSDDGARDVWASAGFAIEPQPQRTGTSVQRIRCNIWIAVCDLGLFAASFGFGSICGGRVHHLGILVHGVYVVCESGRYDCAISKRHVFGYPADGCSVVCAGATGRGICSDDGFSVARPTASGGGGVIQRVTSHCSGGTGASRENYLRGQRNFACEMFGRIPSWVASWRGAYWAACRVRCAIAAWSSDSV